MSRTISRAVWAGTLTLLASAPGRAQEPAALTLAEALELARRNSPTFLTVRNDVGVADWAVREAYGSFLPRADVSGGMRYEDGGSALFGSLTAADIGLTETPAYYFSSYSASATMTLSPQTWYGLAEERATRRAVEADVDAAELQLESGVKRSYLTVLRTRDQVDLRRRQLERAEENLTLAETRASAGVATQLDAKQARVERGRAEVGVLTAEAEYETARLRLLQRLGVEMDRNVELTTQFAVFEPTWTEAWLLEKAVAAHPELRSLAARERAQRSAARTAWSSYLPSLSARAGLSGFARQVGDDRFLVAQAADRLESRLNGCLEFNDLNARLADPYPARDCSAYELTDQRMDSLYTSAVASNRAFPFDFVQQPLTVSVGVSIPVFTGFQRQRRVAEAEAAADDTRQRLRSERLRLTADLAAALLRLRTAERAFRIEAGNDAVATDQLEQARERYRVGLDSFIQLKEAETLKSQADQAYLAAVYTFHEALADLEAAVGQPLRPEGR